VRVFVTGATGLSVLQSFRNSSAPAITRATYHGIAEEGVPLRDIAGVISRRLNVSVVSKTLEEATAYFGSFAHFAALDVPASSAFTRERLGWQPKQAGLIRDLDWQSHFETAAARGATISFINK
jgi:hypothetical protein